MDDQDIPFIGRGPAMLLQGIGRLGSINQSAREMNMSYMKALKMIKRMEASLGGKILKTETGGREHGGAELTPLAEKVLALYLAYEKDVSGYAREKFQEITESLDALAKK